MYLGHIVTPSLSDDEDIGRQYRSLCSRANMLKRKFSYCSEDVKICLFKSYCTSLYTAQLWVNYRLAVYHKFVVCYNNSFRWLMGLQKSCSASNMFVQSGVLSFQELFRKIVYRFLCRVQKSKNELLCKLNNSDIQNSIFARKWRAILTVS